MMAKKGVVEHIWYVQPMDENSNRVIGHAITDADGSADDFAMCHVHGHDQEIPLWRCPNYQFITALKRSRKRLGISFRVCVQHKLSLIRSYVIDNRSCRPSKRKKSVRQ